MPRFVLLHHEMPPDAKRDSHWDFMLQADGVLKTWALHELPQPGKTISATALGDHRLAYLDYEGPISDGRGRVTRCDEGSYRLIDQSDGVLTVDLSGDSFSGRVRLRATDDSKSDSPGDWTFTLEAD